MSDYWWFSWPDWTEAVWSETLEIYSYCTTKYVCLSDQYATQDQNETWWLQLTGFCFCILELGVKTTPSKTIIRRLSSAVMEIRWSLLLQLGVAPGLAISVTVQTAGSDCPSIWAYCRAQECWRECPSLFEANRALVANTRACSLLSTSRADNTTVEPQKCLCSYIHGMPTAQNFPPGGTRSSSGAGRGRSSCITFPPLLPSCCWELPVPGWRRSVGGPVLLLAWERRGGKEQKI